LSENDLYGNSLGWAHGLGKEAADGSMERRAVTVGAHEVVAKARRCDTRGSGRALRVWV
jgi:hypothetical protein